MSKFEFVFSLIGLLLGLSLVEILGGLVRSLKARSSSRVSILTSLLGVFVLLDVTTFWGIAWGVRDFIDSSSSIWPILGIGVVFTSVYYVSSSLVFPDQVELENEIDAHYWKHKRLVAGLVLVCELAAMSADYLFNEVAWPWMSWAVNIGIVSGTVLLCWSRWRRVDISVLGFLIGVLIWTFCY